MKAKRRILSIFFAICLVIMSVCFNQVEADDFVVSENMSQLPLCTIDNANDVISGEDVCTLEMLGNHTINHTSHQTAVHNVDNTHLIKEHSAIICNMLCLQSSFYFSYFAETVICSDDAETAQIICFIHNKDGKKKNLL